VSSAVEQKALERSAQRLIYPPEEKIGVIVVDSFPALGTLAAMRFIEYLSSTDVQAMFLNDANWIPANASVDTSSNPVVGGFLEQVPYSDPFPVVAELGATWEPMGDAVTKIIEGVLPAEEAIAEACELINTTNNK